jgi:thiol:disulfide interchange protein
MRAGLALLIALLLWPPIARAAESAPVRSERAIATLVSDTDRAEPGRPLHLGLRLRLAPGWHTYWRNSGDAGAPPELTLTLPAGVGAGSILWPVPERLLEAGIMSYAYTGDLVLPVEVTSGAGGLQAEAKASWLVCANVCVPEEGTFHLALPEGAVAPSAEAPLFAASLARLPRPSPFAATVEPDGALVLRGDGLSPGAVRDAWFFPDRPDRIIQAAPQPVEARDGAIRVQLKGAAADAFTAPLDGVIVLRDGAGQDTALAISAAPGATAAMAAGGEVLSLPRALLFALLAGVILNAMPCVFPVLAMKALALAKLSGAARGAVRLSALSYTAGVILAFLALGGALLAARAAGTAAGWGFQFQSPAFVVVLAWLLVLVGLNLSGVYGVGAGLAGVGAGFAGRRGQVGSFFTGLLAVVVATPCTAPFMGAAIATALAAPPAATLLVFTAMGVGLAAPYALLALVPGAARLLPRPGPWMDVLKQALAFPMYAAAAWLLWVVSQQSGSAGVLGAAVGFVLVGFGAWVVGLGQRAAEPRGRRLAHAAAFAAALGAAAVLAGVVHAPAPAEARAGSDGGDAFTPARLASLRAEGRPVFVDATAAWCVTCLVNERVALAPAAVREAFARYGVIYLRADWTRQDPDITALLRRFGRDGVPLYVVFPAARDGAPDVLPQVLTEGIVLDALKRAAGAATAASG